VILHGREGLCVGSRQVVLANPREKAYLHYTAADRIRTFPAGITDDTHFNELGARAMAALRDSNPRPPDYKIDLVGNLETLPN
jgi:hypothetical protein